MNSYFNKILPYIIGIVILITVCSIFLAPQFSGKILQGEGIQNAGMIQEAKTYYEENGKFTFWTNSMFSGMPTYTMYGGGPKAGVSGYIASAMMLFRSDSLGYLFIFALSAYLGFVFFKLNPWIALLGALAATFASTHIGVLEAGHNSKLASAGFSILTLAGIYRLSIKDFVWGGLAFMMGILLSLALGHPQMTYYYLLAVGILSLYSAFRLLKEKDFKTLGIAGAICAAGLLLALGTNLYQSVTMRNFAKDTMRGGSILSTQSANVQNQGTSKSSEGGLGYEYAMGWSDGVKDLLAFVIPGAVGGSNNEKVKENTKINDLLRRNGLQPQAFLPLYWGDLTFTASPDYVGAIIVLLFLLGLIYVKGPFKWGMVSAIILLLLMSLGKNFDAFNRFLFEYLPMLNKFRTPNSIHNVSVCLIAIFAMMGLSNFLNAEDRKKALFDLYKMGGGLLAFILLFGLGGSMFFDFSTATDARYDPKIISIFQEARKIYLNQDSIRTLLIVLAGIAALYFYLKGKLNKNITIGLLTVVSVYDLYSVARRYISAEDWKPATSIKNPVPMRVCDQQILTDPALYYRVFDLSSGDPFQSATSAYYHKLIGGYNPAKLRRYQDIIDAYLSKGDEKMMDMLNTKYLISQNEQVVPRPSALGNAWLVGEVRFVQTPDEEIDAIKSLDPVQTAVLLDKEFPEYISANSKFTKSGSITLTEYEPNRLKFTSQVDGEQFAVFSDVWYDSGRGWQAYVDGKEVDHVRVDYILRGLKIPAGIHTIEFKFNPPKVILTNTIAFWLSNLSGIIILGLLGWLLINDYRHWKEEMGVELAIKNKISSTNILIKKNRFKKK